jgi:hypothetical protein
MKALLALSGVNIMSLMRGGAEPQAPNLAARLHAHFDNPEAARDRESDDGVPVVLPHLE